MLLNRAKNKDETSLNSVTYGCYIENLFLNGVVDINPQKTDTILQYYLVENMALGLVRDVYVDGKLYGPAISDKWQRNGIYEWKFYYLKQKYWSNGTPITPEQIIDNLVRLSQVKSFHLQILKSMKNIEWLEKEKAFSLFFKNSVGEELLHELSLADAVLIHPEDHLKWKITSGPYFLDFQDFDTKKLILKSNVFLESFFPGRPQRVEVIEAPFEIMDNNPNYDDMKNIDLVTLGVYAHQKPIRWSLNKNYLYKVFPSSLVYFFGFNPDNLKAVDNKLRYCLAQAVKEFQVILPEYPSYMSKETQMLPVGYSGRVRNAESIDGFNIDCETSISTNDNIVVVSKKFSLSPLYSFMAQVLNKYGFKIKTADTLETSDGPMPLAIIRAFKGNQKDALSSWSFLLQYRPYGLSLFSDNLKSKYDQIVATEKSEKREILLEDFHREVLENNFLIPLFKEATVYIHKSHLSLENWNPFDSRVRFYEIEKAEGF